MFRDAALALLAVVAASSLAIGCAEPAASPSSPSVAPAASPNAPAASPTDAPSPCCASYQEIRALDGRRVVLVGVYDTTAVRKGTRNADEDARARTVAIRISANVSVMLEVYYAPAGTRSEAEVARFAHQRVRVVGTLRARTPDRSDPSGPLQTMIGPCVTDIEAIEVVGPE